MIQMTQGSWIGRAVVMAAVLGVALVACPASAPAHATMAPPGRTTLRPHTIGSTSTTPPADWPVFHADAARDGVQQSDTLFTRANATSLVQVATAGFTTTGAAMGSPVVYSGTVYYSVDIPVTTSTGNRQSTSTVLAVNASSGVQRWARLIPPCGASAGHAYIYASPAATTGLVNGVATVEVFVGFGGGYNPATGKQLPGCVFDFNGRTGQIIWKYPLPAGVFSSPAIVTTNSGRLVVLGDDTTLLRAFPVNYTGPIGGAPTQAWAYDTNADPPPPSNPRLCGTGGCGDTIWSSPAAAQVVVGGQVHHFVYFGMGASNTHQVGRIDAVDMDIVANGAPHLAWTFWDPHPVADNDFGAISVLTDAHGMGERVYGGTNSGHVYGVDATTGALYFDFYVPDHNNGYQMMVHSTPAVIHTPAHTEVVFGSGCTPSKVETCTSPQTGFIWAIDALSADPHGTLLWQTADYGGDIVASPIAVNSGSNAVIFAAGPWLHGLPQRGNLLALAPDTGAALASYQVFGQQYGSLGSPAVYGGRLFLTYGYVGIYDDNGTGGGGLAAFRCGTCS